MSHYSENIIIGAGAAGLFCAAQLGKLGKQVTIFDNGKKIGRKILMSGGGFCNFTNMEITLAVDSVISPIWKLRLAVISARTNTSSNPP